MGILMSSGLYYKHVMLVNDASSGIIKWRFKFIDATRGVIYNRHMFIVQATKYNFKFEIWQEAKLGTQGRHLLFYI